MWRWKREGRDIVCTVNDLGHENFRAEVGRIRPAGHGFTVVIGGKRFMRLASLSSAICILCAKAGLDFADVLEAFEELKVLEGCDECAA